MQSCDCADIDSGALFQAGPDEIGVPMLTLALLAISAGQPAATPNIPVGTGGGNIKMACSFVDDEKLTAAWPQEIR